MHVNSRVRLLKQRLLVRDGCHVTQGAVHFQPFKQSIPRFKALTVLKARSDTGLFGWVMPLQHIVWVIKRHLPRTPNAQTPEPVKH